MLWHAFLPLSRAETLDPICTSQDEHELRYHISLHHVRSIGSHLTHHDVGAVLEVSRFPARQNRKLVCAPHSLSYFSSDLFSTAVTRLGLTTLLSYHSMRV